MKKAVVIFLTAIIFISCDPGVINNYVVANESDYLFEVRFRLQEGFRTLNTSGTIQTIKINPKSKVEIVEYGEIGIALDKREYFLEAFDTLSIYPIGMSLKKSIRDRSNWKYQVISEGLFSMDEVEYKFIINNEDLKDRNE